MDDIDTAALANNKILKWDSTAMKYVLADDGQGIPDALNNGTFYAR